MAQTYKSSYRKPSYTTSQTKKPTYEVGGTKYVYGETYKTTGQPKVERNTSTRQEFLKSKGYKKVPKGYQVDHIVPLSQGGKDVPDNMQLITKEQHKQKTAFERKNVSTTNNKTYKYSTPKATKNTNKTPSYKYTIPKSSSKTSSYNFSKPKSTSNSFTSSSKCKAPKLLNKTSSYNYPKTKTSSGSYKMPSYKYKTPKSYSSGSRKRK